MWNTVWWMCEVWTMNIRHIEGGATWELDQGMHMHNKLKNLK